MYEYTSDVFAVGLEGFAPVDNGRIARMAAGGWEPTLMTTVHNGFAALVLFRRERTGGPAPATRVRRAAAGKGAAPAAKATRSTRTAPAAGTAKATGKATPAKAAKATTRGRR